MTRMDCFTGRLGPVPHEQCPGVVWAAGAGETSGVLPSVHGVGVALLAFSPDGHWLASMGHEAQHILAVYT